MIVYLYHTLPSWPLSCSSLSRYVLFTCFCKYKHKLLLVTTPWFLWVASWTWGPRSHRRQSRRENALCSWGAEPSTCNWAQDCAGRVPAAGGCSVPQAPEVRGGCQGSALTVPSVTRACCRSLSQLHTGTPVQWHLYSDRTPLCSTLLASPSVLKPMVLIYVFLGFISRRQDWAWVFPFAAVWRSRQMLLPFMCKSPR